MKRLISAIFLFIMAHVVIFTASLSDVKGTLSLFTSGYAMHFLTFFGLSFLLSLILIHERLNLKTPFTICFIYSVFVAIIIEFMQKGFTSYRYFSYYDILTGVIGAGAYSLIGITIYELKWFSKYWQRAKL